MKNRSCYLYTIIILLTIMIITPNICNSNEIYIKKVNVGEKICKAPSFGEIILKYGGMSSDKKFSIVVLNLGMRIAFAHNVFYPIDIDLIVLYDAELEIREVTPNYIKLKVKK